MEVFVVAAVFTATSTLYVNVSLTDTTPLFAEETSPASSVALNGAVPSVSVKLTDNERAGAAMAGDANPKVSPNALTAAIATRIRCTLERRAFCARLVAACGPVAVGDNAVESWSEDTVVLMLVGVAASGPPWFSCFDLVAPSYGEPCTGLYVDLSTLRVPGNFQPRH